MKFAWWMAPVIGVGACAIANGALIATSLRVRPQKVEDKPYAASAHEDERAAARAGFSAEGWSIDSAVDGTGVTVRVVAGGQSRPGPGVVRFYRPDDAAADLAIPWSDPLVPLRCALPRPGAWSMHVVLRNEAGAMLAYDHRLNRP